MDSSTKSRQFGPKASLIITTALASVALTGCTTSVAAPRADASFSKAQAALEAGKTDQAIMHAEAAVLNEPRNSGFRAMLGAAYLDAGRFEAAAASFNDAMQLGHTDARTTLSYALAAIATGNSSGAVRALRANETNIGAADFGLAMALAGQPERAVHVLTNALRGGENTAKIRQNLAYTYALAGNWRAARIMAAEDVPADQLDARLTEWAADARPEDVTKRVSKLLGVNPAPGGQPAHLALANFPNKPVVVAEKAAQPSMPTLVAEAASQSDAPVARELNNADLIKAPAKSPIKVKPAPAVATKAPAGPRFVSNPVVQKLPTPVVASRTDRNVNAAVPAPVNMLREAGAKSAQAAKPTAVAANKAVSAPRYVSNPVVQRVPVKAADNKAPRRVASASSQRRMAAPTPVNVPAAAPKKDGTHLVQLGSYSSRSDAQTGWASLQRKFPQLKGHDVVITKAKVKGKIFYRVAAAGFGSRDARSMCGTVKSSGRGCFAYAATNPPKGAIDSGVRVAARTR